MPAIYFRGKPINGSGGGLPGVEIGVTPVTQEEYDAIPEEERKDKLYLVTDADAPSASTPSLESYDTDNGWHVRKWSDGYVEMSYFESNITTQNFTAYQNIAYCGILYPDPPIQLVEMYSFDPQWAIRSGNTNAIVACTGCVNSLATPETPWNIVLQRLSTATVPSNGDLSIRITGRWK